MDKLRVLFVCSGNNVSGRSPNVDIQAEGVMQAGVEVEFFEIIGKGVTGYLKNVSVLRKYLRKNQFDVIHAHYALSGIVASLAGAAPLVVTIMGSELNLGRMLPFVTKFFSRFVWNKVIVQSAKMSMAVGKDAVILPNGVDLQKFKDVDRKKAIELTGFKSGKQIIWVSDPGRDEKNFGLAERAVEALNDAGVSLLVVNGVPHDDIPFYFRAADVLLLTSKWEGSPIVVKEALASGLPVVSVDVGDVRELLSGVDGCYVAGDSPEDIALQLKKALSFTGRTDGIKNVEHLDIKIISERLKYLYLSMAGQ